MTEQEFFQILLLGAASLALYELRQIKKATSDVAALLIAAAAEKKGRELARDRLARVYSDLAAAQGKPEAT